MIYLLERDHLKTDENKLRDEIRGKEENRYKDKHTPRLQSTDISNNLLLLEKYIRYYLMSYYYINNFN